MEKNWNVLEINRPNEEQRQGGSREDCCCKAAWEL